MIGRLLIVCSLVSLIFFYALIAAHRAPQPVAAKTDPFPPLCFDPFHPFTGVMFEDCSKVNRYWYI